MKLLSIIFALLMSILGNAHAISLTDVKFGQSQIADSQWNVSACLYTSTCQIYSKQPGTAYKIPWTSGQISWASGDYIKFSLTGNSLNPYNAIQYTSSGVQKAVMGTGHIVNMGTGYFFFVGNDNNTGQLFSGAYGMNTTAGVSWTGTLNPTLAQADTYANANYSTAPLAAGSTYTSAPTTPTYTSNITTVQQTKVDSAKVRRNAVMQNAIYIEQVSDNNTVNISQAGRHNQIGANTNRAVLNGSNNQLTIKQGTEYDTLGKNLSEFNIQGNLNQVRIYQGNDVAGNPNVTDSNNHMNLLGIIGNSNNVTTQQTNTGGQGGHYMDTTINGNSNNLTLKQLNNGDKIMFTNAQGSNNTVNATQQGTGNHYLDVTLNGAGHSATILQNGSFQSKATVNLTNAGGPSILSLTQNSTSAAQTYSIQQSCATASGCGVSVTQP
jgi:hypothetical protein